MSQRPPSFAASKAPRVIGLRFHEYSPKSRPLDVANKAFPESSFFSFSCRQPAQTKTVPLSTQQRDFPTPPPVVSPSNVPGQHQDHLSKYFECASERIGSMGPAEHSAPDGFQIMRTWMKKSKKPKFGEQCMFYMRMNRSDTCESAQMESLVPHEQSFCPSLAPSACMFDNTHFNQTHGPLVPSPTACSPSTPPRDSESCSSSSCSGGLSSPERTPPRTETPENQTPSSFFPSMPAWASPPMLASAHPGGGSFPSMPPLNMSLIQSVLSAQTFSPLCSPQSSDRAMHTSAFKRFERRGPSPCSSVSSADCVSGHRSTKRKLEEEDFSRNVMPRQQDFDQVQNSWPLYPPPSHVLPNSFSFPNFVGQPPHAPFMPNFA